MKNRVYSVQFYRFSKTEINMKVWDAFMDSCGIKAEKAGSEAKQKRFKKMATTYKSMAEACVDARASVAKVDFAFNGSHLIVDGVDYGRIGLSEEEKQSIKNVYAYVLCAGTFESDIEPITDAFIDLWGNAYCDTAIGMLREKLAEVEGRYISTHIGPGFFEIGVDKIAHIMEMTEGNHIGIELKGHLMVPLKSCSGFFFEGDKPLNIVKRDCANCKGNRHSCNYCNKQ